MSFFDPFGISTRNDAISYKGQVIRQRPTNLSGSFIDKSNLSHILEFLRTNGYTIYRPGIPTYTTTTLTVNGSGYIQGGGITVQYPFSPQNVVNIYRLSLYEIMINEPIDMEAIFTIPRPPKFFEFVVYVDSFYANNLRYTTSSPSSTVRYAVNSFKYQWPMKEVAGDNDYMVFDNLYLLQNKPDLSSEIYFSQEFGQQLRVQTPEAGHNEPGIAGVLSTNYAADELTVYEALKQRDPNYNVAVLALQVMSSADGEFRLNQMSIAYSYSFSVEY